jgi:hypothetical protein
MAWRAGGWTRQPWTLWTAAWVHTSAGALAGNLLAIAALAIAGAALGAGTVAALALALAWPLTTLALLVWPQVTSYAGLDGCVFRTIVTGRFGIVTAEFGNVTGDSGSVTDALSAPAQVAVVELSRGRCWCCV